MIQYSSGTSFLTGIQGISDDIKTGCQNHLNGNLNNCSFTAGKKQELESLCFRLLYVGVYFWTLALENAASYRPGCGQTSARAGHFCKFSNGQQPPSLSVITHIQCVRGVCLYLHTCHSSDRQIPNSVLDECSPAPQDASGSLHSCNKAVESLSFREHKAVFFQIFISEINILLKKMNDWSAFF